jgi:hypothetical protein
VSLVRELQRRSVFKVGAAYLVVGWLVIQAASIALPAFDAPPTLLRGFILLVFLGFPLALVLAWAFEMTPDGVKVDARGTGSAGLFAIAGVLAVISLAWFYKGQPSYRMEDPQAQEGPPSIAVLPFANLSSDPEQEFLSDGMTEELLNVLAKNPALKVAARTSVFEFKGKGGDVRAIGKQLGVSHMSRAASAATARRSGSRPS